MCSCLLRPSNSSCLKSSFLVLWKLRLSHFLQSKPPGFDTAVALQSLCSDLSRGLHHVACPPAGSEGTHRSMGVSASTSSLFVRVLPPVRMGGQTGCNLVAWSWQSCELCPAAASCTQLCLGAVLVSAEVL